MNSFFSISEIFILLKHWTTAGLFLIKFVWMVWIVQIKKITNLHLNTFLSLSSPAVYTKLIKWLLLLFPFSLVWRFLLKMCENHKIHSFNWEWKLWSLIKVKAHHNIWKRTLMISIFQFPVFMFSLNLFFQQMFVRHQRGSPFLPVEPT